jgi:hypothetical protein
MTPCSAFLQGEESEVVVQKLCVLVGLPGSGKSTWIQANATDGNCLIIDDYLTRAPAPRRFADSLRFSELSEALKGGLTCYISDVRFCESGLRGEISAFVESSFSDVLLEWVYFANDPEECKKRVRKRNRENVLDWELELVDRLSAVYVIPEGEQFSLLK